MIVSMPNSIQTREGCTLTAIGDETRIRIAITDNWTGEVFKFELGSIGAGMLATFIKVLSEKAK